ncbi:MAG: hypothetical protein K5839_05345 [Treponemataceae bacterium]|nr:hypothetical protein [Treponemataceae bacterium]
MKKFEKKFLAFLLVLCFALGFAGAKEKLMSKDADGNPVTNLNMLDNFEINHPKYKKPARKDIVVVGRVILNPTEDMDFYIQTRKVAEDKLAQNDLYKIAQQSYIYSSDEFFYATVDKPKRKDNGELDFTVVFNYYIHGSMKLNVRIPVRFNFNVDDDTEYVYLGTLKVTTIGDDFTIKSVDHIDEYDQAVEFIESNVKTKKDIIVERATYKF